jgi:hypothetical protein
MLFTKFHRARKATEEIRLFGAPRTFDNGRFEALLRAAKVMYAFSNKRQETEGFVKKVVLMLLITTEMCRRTSCY